jgi:hypothetical protein
VFLCFFFFAWLCTCSFSQKCDEEEEEEEDDDDDDDDDDNVL